MTALDPDDFAHDDEARHMAHQEVPEYPDLSVDLRRAATTVVNSQDPTTGWPFHYETGVVTLWEALTGLEGEPALALARQLADSPTPVTAHATPF